MASRSLDDGFTASASTIPRGSRMMLAKQCRAGRNKPACRPAVIVLRAAAGLIALVVWWSGAGSRALAQSLPLLSHQVVGLHEAYVVQKGDTLRVLSSR